MAPWRPVTLWSRAAGGRITLRARGVPGARSSCPGWWRWRVGKPACSHFPRPRALRRQGCTLDRGPTSPRPCADRLAGIPAFDSIDRTYAAAERAALEAGNRGAPVGRSREGRMEQFHTRAEVAAELGVCERTLQRHLPKLMVACPALTVTRIGRAVLFTDEQRANLLKAMEWRSPTVSAPSLRTRTTVWKRTPPGMSAQERVRELTRKPPREKPANTRAISRA